MSAKTNTILRAASPVSVPKWSLISAVNNEQILKSCLLSSPDVSRATEVILQTGYPSAALAYNAALAKATTDLLVFAHQDVSLPEGWLVQVQKSLQWLAENDPDWAVAGVWGVKQGGSCAGNVYCTGLGRILGRPGALPTRVRTLDELLLIVRKSSGVRFDERLPGFHMYGTDICMEAQNQGLKCYAISAFCIHNTNGYNLLPWQFWKNYMHLRRKWRSQLPIKTSCTEITQWCWPMFRWNMFQAVNIFLRRHKPGKRVSNPQSLYEGIVASSELDSRTTGS